MTSIRSWLRAAVRKLESVLFDVKSDWESITQKVEDIHSFPTGIYMPSSDQRFRCYDFLPDNGAAENCNSRQIAATKGD
jgi:hypothetical protein